MHARTLLAAATLAGFAAAGAGAQPAQDTLGAVRARGQLVRGVATAGVGLSIPDSQGV